MRKTVFVLILSITLLAVFGADAKAQGPKEGTTSITQGSSGTFKALPMGKERLQLTYEFIGVTIGDTPEDLLHNGSVRCLGAYHAVKGEYTDDSGFCVITLPDEDQVFYTFKGVGKVGRMFKGAYTVVGGTGKLVGIQGSGEYTGISLRHAAEGTTQIITRAKGRYKLP